MSNYLNNKSKKSCTSILCFTKIYTNIYSIEALEGIFYCCDICIKSRQNLAVKSKTTVLACVKCLHAAKTVVFGNLK